MKSPIATVLILLLPLMGFAETVELKASEGRAEFIAVGNPGFLKIHGKGEGPSGQLKVKDSKIEGLLELELSKLDTGMELRNQHMKEKYLEIEKYPKAKLVIKGQALPRVWQLTEPEIAKSTMKAVLELHGETKELDVSYSVDSNKKLVAEFQLKLSDFKVGVPSFMGVTVADEVKIKIDSQIKTPEPHSSKAKIAELKGK
jgi:polyisoprenoid-binding protein YceI